MRSKHQENATCSENIAPSNNIFVVEDDAVTARIIETALTSSGYTVTLAANGETAWDTLTTSGSTFHCILLDCMLPGIDGIEILRRIKTDKHLRNIPVILETALDDADNICKAFALGAFSYLTKPLKLSLLRSMVNAALERYQAHFASLQEKHLAERSLEHLESGVFRCKTLDEAQNLARILALACPDPDKVASGLLELLINGIEHGNLGITYEEKTQLVLSESWRKEVERRQSMDCYKEQKVLVDFQRLPGELVLTIRDEGPGFNCQCYLDFDPERAAHPHGRGIAMACAFNLENVEYIGTGNTVRIRIKTPVKKGASDHEAFQNCPPSVL